MSIVGCNIVGGDVRDYGNGLYVGDGYIMLVAEHPVNCSGQVNTWEYWAKSSGSLKAMVVRPDAGGDETKWTIVGVNDITVDALETDQKSTFSVPINDRISAEVNDVIAVAVDANDNPNIPRIRLQDFVNGFSIDYVGDHTALVPDAVITVTKTSYTSSISAEICCNN